MKKALITIAIAFLVVGIAAAQPFGQWNQPKGTAPGRGQGQSPWGGRAMGPGMGQTMGRGTNLPAAGLTVEKISLEGTLELVNARVAIKKDNKTYYVMIPSRLYGFVDGLKEGASIKVEGYSHAVPGVENSFAVRVNTLELGGKTIDLGVDTAVMGQRMGAMGGRTGRWGR